MNSRGRHSRNVLCQDLTASFLLEDAPFLGGFRSFLRKKELLRPNLFNLLAGATERISGLQVVDRSS